MSDGDLRRRALPSSKEWSLCLHPPRSPSARERSKLRLVHCSCVPAPPMAMEMLSPARLVGHAAAWWFPLLVAVLSLANTFVLFAGGPLALLFCAAAAAQKQRFVFVALTNAAGVTLGIAIFAVLLEHHGDEWARASFPSVFSSGTWQTTESLVQSYGGGGIFLVSCLPVLLHPVVIVGMLAHIKLPILVGAVFAGRCIKYVCAAAPLALGPYSFARAADFVTCAACVCL